MVCLGAAYFGSNPKSNLVLKFRELIMQDQAMQQIIRRTRTDRPLRRGRLSRRECTHFFGIVIASFCLATPQVLGDEPEASDRTAIPLQNAILKTIVNVTIAAEAQGVLEKVPIDIGTSVVPDAPLASIRDDAVRVQLTHAELELVLAEQKSNSEIDVLVTTKSAAVAENEYRRALEANRSVPNTYPPNEIDRLKLVFERTQLEVRRAQEQRDQLKIQTQLAKNRVDEIENVLRKHIVTAPTKGVVVSVEHRAGEWVEPGTPIATIVNLERLRVEGFVRETDASRIGIGDMADVIVEQRETSAREAGTVVFVSPDINSVSDLVRVFVDVENTNGQLRPGLRTTVTIQATVPTQENGT